MTTFVLFFESVCLHNSKNAWPNFTKVFAHVACGWSSVLLRWHCDTLCTSSFTDDVVFHTMGPMGRRVTEWQYQWAWPLAGSGMLCPTGSLAEWAGWLGGQGCVGRVGCSTGCPGWSWVVPVTWCTFYHVFHVMELCTRGKVCYLWLSCFQHVAWVDSRQDHHQALSSLLQPARDLRRTWACPRTTWLRRINAEVKSGRLTSGSTQPQGRPTITCSSDVLSTWQHSIMGHAAEEAA